MRSLHAVNLDENRNIVFFHGFSGGRCSLKPNGNRAYDFVLINLSGIFYKTNKSSFCTATARPYESTITVELLIIDKHHPIVPIVQEVWASKTSKSGKAAQYVR